MPTPTIMPGPLAVASDHGCARWPARFAASASPTRALLDAYRAHRRLPLAEPHGAVSGARLTLSAARSCSLFPDDDDGDVVGTAAGQGTIDELFGDLLDARARA